MTLHKQMVYVLQMASTKGTVDVDFHPKFSKVISEKNSTSNKFPSKSLILGIKCKFQMLFSNLALRRGGIWSLLSRVAISLRILHLVVISKYLCTNIIKRYVNINNVVNNVLRQNTIQLEDTQISIIINEITFLSNFDNLMP